MKRRPKTTELCACGRPIDHAGWLYCQEPPLPFCPEFGCEGSLLPLTAAGDVERDRYAAAFFRCVVCDYHAEASNGKPTQETVPRRLDSLLVEAVPAQQVARQRHGARHRAEPEAVVKVNADTVTDEQIRELRNEQLRSFREADPHDPKLEELAVPLDYTFAALRGRPTPGLFTGKTITPDEGRARCAEIWNARHAKDGES